MKEKRIVLLAGRGDTTAVVYHFLADHFLVEKVIVEDSVPKKEFLKKRAKKLGWLSVAGQILFQVLVAKPMQAASKKRVKEILQHYHLSPEEIDPGNLLPVPSVNAGNCLQALQQLQPDIVVVHGTRIISKKILQNVPAIFINIHAGITPRYRGSHGAYWALANNDAENCGVTVHLVDAGIDTGNILAQKKIPFTKKDNFATYAYLQLGEGLFLLKEVLERIMRGDTTATSNTLNSALWHHPTLWTYVFTRIKKGVK